MPADLGGHLFHVLVYPLEQTVKYSLFFFG